jgi:hypothetical protein
MEVSSKFSSHQNDLRSCHPLVYSTHQLLSLRASAHLNRSSRRLLFLLNIQRPRRTFQFACLGSSSSSLTHLLLHETILSQFHGAPIHYTDYPCIVCVLSTAFHILNTTVSLVRASYAIIARALLITSIATEGLQLALRVCYLAGQLASFLAVFTPPPVPSPHSVVSAHIRNVNTQPPSPSHASNCNNVYPTSSPNLTHNASTLGSHSLIYIQATNTDMVQREFFPAQEVKNMLPYKHDQSNQMNHTIMTTGKSPNHLVTINVGKSLALTNNNKTKRSRSATVSRRSNFNPVNRSVNTPKQLQTVRIYSANINGLRGKLDRLKVLAAVDSPDVMACQETKMGLKAESKNVMVDGYQLFRKDRSDSGGGVALYVKESLKAERVGRGIIDSFELISVKLKLGRTTIVVASMYKPPRTPIQEFSDNLANFLSSCECPHVVLCGDTNTCALSNEFIQLGDICAAFNLAQIVDSPTHNGRLIDHIYVSNNIAVHSSGTNPPIEKVHASPWVRITVPHSTPHKETGRTTWNYKRANWPGLMCNLMERNILESVIQLPTVDDAVNTLEKSIKDAMELFIPKNDRKFKKKLPWMTKEITDAHNEERKKYRKWKQSGSLTHKGAYKRLTKQLKKLTFIAKKTHFQRTFEKCSDSAKFWKALNGMIGRKVRSEIPTLSRDDGSSVASKETDKAELLQRQFSSVFNSSNTAALDLSDLQDEEIPFISVKYVLKKMQSLPSNKSPGIDEISGCVIKNSALILAPCLVEIIRRCFIESKYPTAWKTAIITPVPKVTGSSNPSDYRPVSLLPLLSKVAESAIHLILSGKINPLLNEKQFGFRAGRSTLDAILHFQHFVLEGFRSCESAHRPTNVVVIFFDIAKAFDSVPHDKLLENLARKFSLPKVWIMFLRSYLTDRKMIVRVGSSFSSPTRVESGVPQGSVLGPTIFNAFINQLFDVPLSRKASIVMYADDLAYVHPVDESDSVSLVQQDVDSISNRIKLTHLKLNASKCQLMVMGLGRSRGRTQIQISADDRPLQQVSVYKYLGVDIDDTFSFSTHVSKVCLKVKRSIGVLSWHLRKWASRKILDTAISSIALPALLYAIEVWYPPAISLQRKVCKVHKYAARLLTNNFRQETQYEELLKVLNWRPLYWTVAERRLLFLRKYIDSLNFSSSNIFVVSADNNENRRQSERLRQSSARHDLQLKIPVHKNEKEGKLAAAQMRKLWNSLPHEVATACGEKFKLILKTDDLFLKLGKSGCMNVLTDV